MLFAVDYVTKCLFIGSRCGILPKLSGSRLPLIIDFLFLIANETDALSILWQTRSWFLNDLQNIHGIHKF